MNLKEISESRTFSFLHELESLLENGLIKGGDLNNAIVYVDKEISAGTMEKVAFGKDTINVKPNGILDNLTLHYLTKRQDINYLMLYLALMELKYKVKLSLINQGIL
jgi:hypothetical protein